MAGTMCRPKKSAGVKGNFVHIFMAKKNGVGWTDVRKWPTIFCPIFPNPWEALAPHCALKRCVLSPVVFGTKSKIVMYCETPKLNGPLIEQHIGTHVTILDQRPSSLPSITFLNIELKPAAGST